MALKFPIYVKIQFFPCRIRQQRIQKYGFLKLIFSMKYDIMKLNIFFTLSSKIFNNVNSSCWCFKIIGTMFHPNKTLKYKN